MDLLPHVNMVFSKKKRSSSSFWTENTSTKTVEGFCHIVLLSKFLLENLIVQASRRPKTEI